MLGSTTPKFDPYLGKLVGRRLLTRAHALEGFKKGWPRVTFGRRTLESGLAQASPRTVFESVHGVDYQQFEEGFFKRFFAYSTLEDALAHPQTGSGVLAVSLWGAVDIYERGLAGSCQEVTSYSYPHCFRCPAPAAVEGALPLCWEHLREERELGSTTPVRSLQEGRALPWPVEEWVR